jgi:cholest-4-en-3-one 26-monooxygenase
VNVDLGDIDLLDRDVFTQGVPHEWLTYLRNNHPVYHHPEPDGPGFWVITKYDDVFAVGRDAGTYSSDQDRGGVIGLEDQPTEADFSGAKLMLMMDPPEHTRHRKLVNRGFTPRMINALEEHIHELTVRILDAAIAKNECDFVVDVAAELPLQAIAELIGVPYEDRHKLFDWSNRMVGSEDPEYAVSDDEANNARFEMFLYAQQLADERRAAPRDDIVSALLQAEVDGDVLSEMDFNLFFMLLSVAGNETTRNAISWGMHQLTHHPDQLAAWQASFDAMAPNAIEELVRWASPVIHMRRTATEDTEIGDQPIAAGDKVVLWYWSANRDETEFEDGHRFDLTRANAKDQVGFGAGGPHFCLGANLARREIGLMFNELFRWLPDLRVTTEPDRLISPFINGIKRMRCSFTPKAVPADLDA